jgi:hypothetical protein
MKREKNRRYIQGSIEQKIVKSLKAVANLVGPRSSLSNE